MKHPLVSIIIPVYNGSNYVREAIDSALAQTYKNIEIIVINDGSKDDGATENIALSYGDKIRYFYKENGGVSSALNKGICEMKGDYFSWLSHDDVYEPYKIERQIAALNDYHLDDNTLICCDYMFINELSQKIRMKKNNSYFASYEIYDSKEVLKGLLKNNIFNGCCLLIPKKVFTECQMFDEELRFLQDAFMWYKIFMSNFSLFCIDDIAVKNRIHEKQLTQTGQDLFRKECNLISEVLGEVFFEISTKENNFIKLYLQSDAKHLNFPRVKEIILLNKSKKLISGFTKWKIYLICGYGKIRPYLRKAYYKIFGKIKTN